MWTAASWLTSASSRKETVLPAGGGEYKASPASDGGILAYIGRQP